jgi:hypothetical protein
MGDADDVIPGSDGIPAGQNQLEGGYVPNERHDRPTMTTIPVYAKVLGTGLLHVSLASEFRFHHGNIVGEGIASHTDATAKDWIVIPGREGPMELAHAIGYASVLNPEGLLWTGPTPKS